MLRLLGSGNLFGKPPLISVLRNFATLVKLSKDYRHELSLHFLTDALLITRFLVWEEL